MNNFPAMTEGQRSVLIGRLQIYIRTAETAIKAGLATENDLFNLDVRKIALAALTADTSKLAELAAKVRKAREDAADFDGDRRGMWEYQEEQEQLLLEEAVKYTAPPAPVLKPIELASDMKSNLRAHETMQAYRDGWNDRGKADVDMLLSAGYEVKQ